MTVAYVSCGFLSLLSAGFIKCKCTGTVDADSATVAAGQDEEFNDAASDSSQSSWISDQAIVNIFSKVIRLRLLFINHKLAILT